MSTAIMDPATAVTWGPFIQAAEAQYASDPGQVNPATITNMPAGYTLVRTIQMDDSFGPVRPRVFYGFVAVGGDPPTAVVALRGTATTLEWWDDLQWNLVPFTQVPDGGNVAQGFYDIYNTFGTMTPGQQVSTSAPATFAADVAWAATEGLAADVDPADLPINIDPADLPIVVTGHSLGGALATLLVTDLSANMAMQPQAWTFASPRVGDPTFAARYDSLSNVSWRIHNLVDVVPYFPIDVVNNRYQAIATGHAINSLRKAKWTLGCAHSLNTYMHVLSPDTVPLNPACR
jgi:triacylglycerol lipase